MFSRKAAALAAVLGMGLAIALEIAPSSADGLVDLVGLARVAGLNVDEKDAQNAETALRVLKGAIENRGRKTPPKPSMISGYGNEAEDRPRLPIAVRVEVRLQDQAMFDFSRFWGGYDRIDQVDPVALEEAAKSGVTQLEFARLVEDQLRREHWSEQDQDSSRFEESTMSPKGYTWGKGFELQVIALFFAKSKESEVKVDLGKVGVGVKTVDYGFTISASLIDVTRSIRVWPDGPTAHDGLFTAYTQGGTIYGRWGQNRFPLPWDIGGISGRFSKYPGIECLFGACAMAAQAMNEEYLMRQVEVQEFIGGLSKPAPDAIYGSVTKVGREIAIVFDPEDLPRVHLGQEFDIWADRAFTGAVVQITAISARGEAKAAIVRGEAKTIRKGFFAVEQWQLAAVPTEEEPEVIKPMASSSTSTTQTWVERLAAAKPGEVFAEVQTGVDPGGGNFTVTPEPRTGESTGRLKPESPEYLVAMVVERAHFPEEAAKWPVGLVVIAGVAGQPTAAKAIFFGPLDGDEDRYGIWVLPDAVAEFVAGLRDGWVFNAPTKKSELR